MPAPAPAPRDLETLLRGQVAEVERLVDPDGAARCFVQAIDDDEDLVIRPLRRLLDDARRGRSYDPDDATDHADLMAGKAASFYAARTRLRLVTPGGREPREPYDVGLLEGDDAFTNAFLLHHLDELNDQIGLEDAASGISHLDLEEALADDLAPGVDTAWAVARHLGQLSDRQPEEVLRLLNQEDAVGKEIRYADLLLRTTDLRPYELAALEQTGYSPRAELAMVLNNGFADRDDGDVVAERLHRRLSAIATAGQRMAPDLVTSPAELWRWQRGLVLGITGAHHSSWNGAVVPAMREFTPAQLDEHRRATVIGPDDQEPANGEPEGRRCAVHWSGTIRLDQRRVIDAVERLFGPDEPTADELVAGRTGLRALVQAHETLHAPDDAEYGDARSRNWHGWVEAIDRGFGEAGARLDVDKLIDRLPEGLAERLKDVETEYDDPLATAAAQTLAERIGPNPAEVLRTLNHETPDGKLARAAELIVARSPLGERALPPIVRAHVCDRVETALLHRLADIAYHTAQAEQWGYPLARRLEMGQERGERAYESAQRPITDALARLDELGPEQFAAALRAESHSPSPGRRRSRAVADASPTATVDPHQPQPPQVASRRGAVNAAGYPHARE